VPLDPALDISLLTTKSEVIDENTGGIRFFPDGSSTGGRIALRRLGDRATVNVRWSTGAVTLE
jgi:general secretion pathway protein H